MSTAISGKAAIAAWDEKSYVEIDEHRKLTQASIRRRYSGEIEGESTAESLMCYAADDDVTFTGFEHFVGRIGDREGSFVIYATGTYDGTTARSDGKIVAGSGTGGLAGVRGRQVSESTHGDYPNQPYTLEYELG